jgi:hypothetical protein
MTRDDHIAALQALRQTRLIMQAAASLPKRTLRARLDCLIYFHTRVFPWKIRKRGPNGETLNQRVEEGGVYDEQRLGYPRSWRVGQAISRIHKACPWESKAGSVLIWNSSLTFVRRLSTWRVSTQIDSSRLLLPLW